MSESRPSATSLPDPAPDVDPGQLIDALRARGAERFDPVGLRFIEAMARRTATHRGNARQVLERRLARALADYGDRLDRSADAARDAMARGTARFPESEDALRQRSRGPLTDLLTHIGHNATQNPSDAAVAHEVELKSVKYFRSTWSRLSVDRQLTQALADAPENAGPLNSHFLVVQALARMRDISPQYTDQFLRHVDALFWLEQLDSGHSAAKKKTARGDRATKRKAKRGKAG